MARARTARTARCRFRRTALRRGLGLAALCVAGRAGAAEPAALLQAIHHPALAREAGVALHAREIALGPATLVVQDGALFAAEPVDGRTLELVFVGQGRFVLTPPDEVEAGQLELFTGKRTIDAPLEGAVLALADERRVAELFGQPGAGAARSEWRARAASLLARWRGSTERRSAGVEIALFKSLVGDAAHEGYFTLWVPGFAAGDFLFQHDPDEREPIRLASFRRLEMTNWERLRALHELKLTQRRGRLLDVRVEDLGSWDLWLSTTWPHATPGGSRDFEAEHYVLDAALARRTLALDARARIELRAQAGGRRVVHLALTPDLVVSRVRDGAGRDLFFFRSGGEVAVLLPEPPASGARLALEVNYAGRALDWVARKTWSLYDTSLWYPHCGRIDRATYDVTLRWPDSLQVVAGGRLLARGDERGVRWERRTIDRPALAFSFAVGDFVVDRASAGEVEITLALGRGSEVRITPELRAQTMQTVRESLDFFARTFGDYPLDHLTVATVPGSVSQSYLGFVTLSEELVRFPEPFSGPTSWTRDMTIAHEVAHQWWGNAVGWAGYRDQWLSESMANYAAVLWDGRTRGGADRLSAMAAGWRDSLGQTTADGRPLESLGPLVLGGRLNSSRAHDAYRAIVYRKGAVVLSMLARTVGEERFLEILRDIAADTPPPLLTTEAFFASLERGSGRELDDFAARFVYGTGVPEVYYDYAAAPRAEGGWSLSGTARVLPSPHYRHVVVRAGTTWDVQRSLVTSIDAPSTLSVPYRVKLEPNASTEAGGPSGQLELEGREQRFRIDTESRPVELRLDPGGETLARFYSAGGNPKRFLQRDAEELAAAGQIEAAARRYREALAAPPDAAARDPRSTPPRPTDPATRAQDVQIRLALARLWLEQREPEAARAVLAEVERDVAAWDRAFCSMEREALRARADILRGHYQPAYHRLKKTLRRVEPAARPPTPREQLARRRLSAEGAAVSEAYALLAIAAHETGDLSTRDWALREAQARGVDASPLEDPSAAARAPSGGSIIAR